MIYEDRLSSKIEKKAKRLIGRQFTAADIDFSILQVFKYEYAHRRIEIVHTTEEFTCLCPFSGLPDFAKLTIKYIPSTR